MATYSIWRATTQSFISYPAATITSQSNANILPIFNIDQAAATNSAYNLNTATAFLNSVQDSHAHSRITSGVPQGAIMTSHGFASDSLPHVETISTNLRQQIKQGKDINLAVLLIPNYDTVRTIDCLGQEIRIKSASSSTNDPRLLKMLTLSEFMTAFNIYKNVICEEDPLRRTELDNYIQIVNELYRLYGGNVFYRYHLQFSARAAALLQKNFKVDWGVRDKNLITSLCGGLKALACNICQKSDHSTDFCPIREDYSRSSTFNKFRSPTSTESRSTFSGNRDRKSDVYGRPVTLHLGQEICNNYNTKGCSRYPCSFLHICVSCKAKHPRSECRLDKQLQDKKQ